MQTEQCPDPVAAFGIREGKIIKQDMNDRRVFDCEASAVGRGCAFGRTVFFQLGRSDKI
jgi:hypothetical protein